MNSPSVIAAFSEDQVERLTGITKSQLRYWDRTNFFVPSYADENRRAAFSRIYSFRDVAALRVLNVLRNQNNVSLQHLRAVLDRLRYLANDLWIGTKLWAINRRVIFQGPDDAAPQEVSGQFYLPILLGDVVTSTQQDTSQMFGRPVEMVGRIEQHRNVGGNAWVVAGTRIHVSSIKRLAEDGYTPERIIAEYPQLTVDDVAAALRHSGALAAA
jgi:DNA-binding transcriptional MerR regulator